MAAVTLTNLEKRYGQARIVQGVDLKIDDGEFVVLVGPSGCGKSTILRMIAGLEDISGGEVSIGGWVVNEVEPKDRKAAMVFQNYALYPHMNVFDNMSFGLKLGKADKKEIKARVNDAARILHIEPLLDRKPAELSGGQRQRVAMGRAIVRDPSVFLFDEPLSNLDAKLRTRMRIEISELHRRMKATIIYVTHDQVEAMTLGDRIVVIRDGQVEQVGRPMEVFHKPVNTFVAGFIGSPAMNLLPAVLTGDEDGQNLLLGDNLYLPVPENVNRQQLLGQRLILGIRTEDVILGQGVHQFPSAWQVEGHVAVTEPLGGSTLVHVDINGVRATAQCDGRLPVQAGDCIRLAFNLNHVHLFDAQSEKSVYRA